MEIQRPSQVVLPRTSMVVEHGYVEARMAVGLPARGRTVDARAARTVLLEELPEVVRSGLFRFRRAVWTRRAPGSTSRPSRTRTI